jgi:hypothetical protein
MSSNPDKTYWAKAAADPVAPVTLWFYPDLRHLDVPVRRSVLDSSKRKALRHAVSTALACLVLASTLVQFWASRSDQSELHRILIYVSPLFMLAWLAHLFLRTRIELRAALKSEKPGAVDG